MFTATPLARVSSTVDVVRGPPIFTSESGVKLVENVVEPPLPPLTETVWR